MGAGSHQQDKHGRHKEHAFSIEEAVLLRKDLIVGLFQSFKVILHTLKYCDSCGFLG